MTYIIVRALLDSPLLLVVSNYLFLAGIRGVISGETFYCGNKRLMDRLGFWSSIPSEQIEKFAQLQNLGCTCGALAVSGVGVVALFALADKVRSESREAISQLRDIGVDVYMLTGDESGAAYSVAYQVGIENDFVKSGLLPVEKLQIVKRFMENSKGRNGDQTPYHDSEAGQLWDEDRDDRRAGCGVVQRYNKVLFVGDGVNDAPALATSHVGVAMAHGGSAIACDVADIALTSSDISKLPYLVLMGRRVVWVILENIVLSVLTKIVVITLVFLGRGSLWLAIGTDVGSMVSVMAAQAAPQRHTLTFLAYLTHIRRSSSSR